MNASELLSSLGVTMEQAREWIIQNLENPHIIFEVAYQFGINSSMLAEIVDPLVPGVTAADVEGYFNYSGLNGNALNAANLGSGGSSDAASFFPDDLGALASLVAFNTSTGDLSTESLRNAVLDELATDSYYYALFSPDGYEGSGDNLFSGDELGFSHLGNFEATTENLESIYYGTMIKLFKSIDMNEMLEVQNFVTSNSTAIAAGSASILDAYLDLMISVYSDEASPPIIPEQSMVQAIVIGTALAAEAAGGGDPQSLFSGLLDLI